MRIESSITSISWIPSEAIEGLSKIPFEFGITHYDPPPPDEIDDLDALRREDRFREANELRAFIEMDGEGRIIDYGYLGKGHIGSTTTVKLGPAAFRFPAVHLPDIQADPEVGPTSVRFVQTVGARMGLPTPRPVPRKPFVQLWPSIAWTTLALTINADGSATHEVVGASPFPRHWFYDDDGKLIEKSATIDFRQWFNESYGDHTPWGDTDSDAIVTAVGSALERQLSTSIMQSGKKPKIRTLKKGDSLVEQGQPGSEVYLVLDGMFMVEVDGVKVGEVGPGAVIGERSALERGLRTATLWAATKARVAETSPDGLDLSDLRALAATHRAEGES